MRRIVVAGSPDWSDKAVTTTAIRRVMEVYRDPYTLVTDVTDGPGRYAAVVARDHGWSVEPYVVDSACDASCVPGHRRRGGIDGTYCPTARTRALVSQLDAGADLCLMLIRTSHRHPLGERLGQSAARTRGIAVWQFNQKRGA